MNTQKIAISMPADLVAMIDVLSKQKGMSRSRFISTVLHEKVLTEKEKHKRKKWHPFEKKRMDDVHDGLRIVTALP